MAHQEAAEPVAAQGELITATDTPEATLAAGGVGMLPTEAPDPQDQPIAPRSDYVPPQYEPHRSPDHPHPFVILSDAMARGIDVEQLSKLMDLAERYEREQARKAFATAFSHFQASYPPIIKNKKANVVTTTGGNYSYWYADLDQIMSTIRPTLRETGLSVSYDTEFIEDTEQTPDGPVTKMKIRAICTVMHRDGYSKQNTFVVPVDHKMKVNDSQKMGSANSYACRYAVVNALGITTGEDDDAGAANENTHSTATADAPSNDVDNIFPFGKYKGKPWDQVPTDYLEWVVANIDNKPDLVERARRQLEYRARAEQDDRAETGDDPGDPGEPTLAEIGRAITKAKDLRELAETHDMIPDKYWHSVRNFYNKRKEELGGQADPDFDDDIPF